MIIYLPLSFSLYRIRIKRTFDHMSSQLLFPNDAVDNFKCIDFLRSPFDVMLVLLAFLMACKVGRYLSLADVLRILSKNGTEPFLGKPET